MKNKNPDFKDIAIDIAQQCNEHKAEDIKLYDVQEIINFTDYILIATASSVTHLNHLDKFLSEYSKSKTLSKYNQKELHPDGGWILLDYGVIIVHLFLNETREYYNLDKLLFECKKIPLNLQ